ncbi:hypothetical protein BDZ45DRAFT_465107 [Acephala macrosclerotiorum]|nr:hypothetical protein BDZ45DRAFT_465107 [Acephala macrosclerotiorum]
MSQERANSFHELQGSSEHRNGSRPSTKRSASSMINHAPESETDFRHELVKTKTSPDDAEVETGSNPKSKLIHSNPSLIADEDTNYCKFQAHTLQTLSGASSLAIDTPMYLRNVLAHQHGIQTTGIHSNSTVAGDHGRFSMNFQDLDLGSTPRQDQWSLKYAGNDEYSYHLAGIRAQFHN